MVTDMVRWTVRVVQMKELQFWGTEYRRSLYPVQYGAVWWWVPLSHPCYGGHQGYCTISAGCVCSVCTRYCTCYSIMCTKGHRTSPLASQNSLPRSASQFSHKKARIHSLFVMDQVCSLINESKGWAICFATSHMTMILFSACPYPFVLPEPSWLSELGLQVILLTAEEPSNYNW